MGVQHLDLAELEAGIGEIALSPKDSGRLELIVCRPAVDQRETLSEGTLDTTEGLVGDCWRARGSGGTPDGSANPKAQLTLMNVRVAALVAADADRIPLAGDQLYVDFDLSDENAPPGTKLAIGAAIVEISDEPHDGCKKFMDRFGRDAHRFVNTKEWRALNLRGVNAVVAVGGTVRVGDQVRKTAG